jgi:hypothetical protein
MMWRLAVLLAGLALPASAQVIKVTSGEHADFSRLVIALPEAQGWQLGRTAEGYELALDGKTTGFDVSGVFDLIPRDRLTGLFADPTTGNLRLAVGCACHALPFALDDKTIVIDLHDGAAPVGSSFETGLDGSRWPALKDVQGTLVRPRYRRVPAPSGPAPVYDWLSADLPSLVVPTTLPLPEVPDQSAAIREALVSQLAEGAARNVVELALPEVGSRPAPAPLLPDGLPVRLSSEIGLRIGPDETLPEDMQPTGAACITDGDLDIAGWLTEPDISAPYRGIGLSIVGEFDRPQTEEIVAAAKRYIYLGFGAEARALLRAFPVEDTHTEVLLSLSYLVDADRVQSMNAFAGMAGCNTMAALWAYLSDQMDSTSAALNSAGLLRAFSSLPPHLRMHLGPDLSDRLIAAGQTSLAVQIKQAMSRGPVQDTRAIALVASEQLLAEGQAQQAIPLAEEVLADPGDLEVEALVTLVSAKIAAGEPIEATVVARLEAMLDEYEGHQRHSALAGAYRLALVGAGQFTEARAFGEEGQALAPAFWTVLAQTGTDNDLLVHAIAPPTEPVPDAARIRIAARLAALGFPVEASNWSNAQTTVAPPNSLPLSTGEHVEETRLSGAAREASWTENWSELDSLDEGAWGQLANRLGSDVAQRQGVSLEIANASLTASTEARTLISQLLNETPMPVTNP